MGSIICLSFSISTSWKSYILWFILLFFKYLVFRNSSFLLLNGYSIYGLCLTFWTNEFLGSYSNYKFIISFSIFSRMDLWRLLCSQSIIEEVLSLSFSTPISSLWFYNSSSFYLHFHSSNNPLRLNTNNKIPFFPFILIKDFFGFLVISCLYFLQVHFGVSSLSHPDNALEACALVTPLHIVPEWYFLCQYAMLKAVPNKNAGFIILLTSIFILFLFGENRNLTTFTRLMDCNNGFSISFLFISFLSFLWIGAQFPQEKFLSYARILTLYYYFLIMCILLPKKEKKKKKKKS